MSRSDPRYHALDVRAETLTAAQAAKIEQDTDDEVSADLYFARNLSATLRRRGLTATDFAAIMGEDDRRMRRLAAGETFPRYDPDDRPIPPGRRCEVGVVAPGGVPLEPPEGRVSETMTLYRLARSNNGVPDSAPRHLHWRTIGGATSAIVKWWTNEIEAGRGELWAPHTGGLGEPRNFDFERLTYEITVDLTPRDERVAQVICRSTWRWRTYQLERHRVTATVDGVTLEGWSEPVRVNVTEWSTAPIPDGRYKWAGPYEPTSARHIPIVKHVIEFGDEP